MNPEILQITLTGLAAAAGTFFTFLAVLRRQSVSERTLWVDAAHKLTTFHQSEITRLIDANQALRTKLTALTRRVDVLEAQVQRLRHRLHTNNDSDPN